VHGERVSLLSLPGAFGWAEGDPDANELVVARRCRLGNVRGYHQQGDRDEKTNDEHTQQRRDRLHPEFSSDFGFGFFVRSKTNQTILDEKPP